MKINISRETEERINEYQKLLFKWNEKINLIAKSTTADFWQRHIIDSLQLMNLLACKDIKLIDIGSGAGLPGLILSFAGVKSVTLVEADSRKAAFLVQAARLSANKVTIINERVEDLRLSCDVITTRAFSEIEKIFEYTKKITTRQKYLLLKGENYHKELINAQKSWLFDIICHNSVTSDKSKILEITNLAKI